jgi:hypothetical protein
MITTPCFCNNGYYKCLDCSELDHSGYLKENYILLNFIMHKDKRLLLVQHVMGLEKICALLARGVVILKS